MLVVSIGSVSAPVAGSTVNADAGSSVIAGGHRPNAVAVYFPCDQQYYWDLERGKYVVNPAYPCTTPPVTGPTSGRNYACTKADDSGQYTTDHCLEWTDIGIGPPNVDCYYSGGSGVYKTCLPRGSVAPSAVRRVAAGSITAVSPGAAAGATAVLANLTMVDGTLPGYITADKCSALVPGGQTKSNGNHDIAVAIANLSVVPIDIDGKFCLYNQEPVNLIADVQGYFAPSTTDGQLFIPSTPTRKLDTRIAPLTTPPAGSITKIQTGAPVGTTAVLVNLTMVDGAAPGYITADKCTSLNPGPQTKSSGNHNTSTAIANVAVVPVDSDGSFCIYNQQTVNLVVDLEGSFTSQTPGAIGFTSLTPSRKLDTRVSPTNRPTPGSITRIETGAGKDTTAVLVNLTMVDGTAPGYITADKCTSLTPGPQAQSSGNHGTATAIANLAVVPVDTDGSFCIYNQQPVNLIVDLQGTFSPTGTQHFFPTGPTRVIDTR